ncbi:hypothetical protein [Nocardiopsis alba]|uniref:hypothetical protein n=1 Tax=Nocardiopsis alba TaxID=53437 RepID=UPI0033A14EA6
MSELDHEVQALNIHRRSAAPVLVRAENNREWLQHHRQPFDLVRPGRSRGFFTNPESPDQELGNRLDSERGTGHSGCFEDEETMDYLGDVLTGGTP